MTSERGGGFSGLVGDAIGRLRQSASLRHSLLIWTTAGLVCTAGTSGAVSLLHMATASSLVGAAIASIVWWGFVSTALCCGAALLNTPDGMRVQRYGVPNGLTALRSYACLPLILTATLSLPGRTGLYIWCSLGFAAGMLDAVDGIIARRIGPLTDLGRALDPASDALFFSMAAVGNLSLGIIPVWLALFMLIRYLGPLLLTPVILITGRRPELGHTDWGRRNTILTGVVLFCCMWTRLLDGSVGLVALVLGAPVLLPTAALHVVALIERVRDASKVAAA